MLFLGRRPGPSSAAFPAPSPPTLGPDLTSQSSGPLADPLYYTTNNLALCSEMYHAVSRYPYALPFLIEHILVRQALRLARRKKLSDPDDLEEFVAHAGTLFIYHQILCASKGNHNGAQVVASMECT